jgi:hypothetical protein
MNLKIASKPDNNLNIVTYSRYAGHPLTRQGWRSKPRAAAATVTGKSTLRPSPHRGDVAALPTVT